MGERVALIPARGGSQRIPRKNIKEFLGVPALVRLIRTLQEAAVFDAIYVSTDDEEIAAVAVEAGAQVPFMRPESLSGHITGARPVIQHAIRTLELSGECTVGVFYPTAVLLEAKDIQRSLSMFQDSDSEFVLSVAEFPAPISRALAINEAGFVAPINDGAQARRTQDLEVFYHDLGQFYWGAGSSWLTDIAVVQAQTQGYIIEPWRAVDIDTPDDWRRAEMMFQALHEVI